MSLTLALITVLFVKHFVVDFLLQDPYQYLNKGTYGHLGGIVHSGLHTIATFVLLGLIGLAYPHFHPTFELVVAIALIEGIIHYHIDYLKVNINTKLGWGPTTHEEYWWLLGADQLLHSLTYVGIVWYLV
jgi:hypothetical protein